MQEQREDYKLLAVSLTIAVGLAVAIVACSKHRKIQMKRKLSQARKKQEDVPRDIIILAVQISNFIILYSEKKRQRYKTLNIQEKSLALKVGNFLTSVNPCFFQRFPPKAIRKFFKDLKAIDNIKLVLYTNLDHQIADEILKNLNIGACFEIKDRIYTHAQRKIADIVDPDTGRVIILSANHQDQDRSVASHHGLILELGRGQVLLEENILNDLKDCFIELSTRGRSDTLHEEMHILTSEKGLPVFNDDTM